MQTTSELESEPQRREETVFDIVRDADKLSRMSYISSECCIFKVPNILYRHDKDAYEPVAFSIGPLHLGRDHLKATEKIKMQYLHGLISRVLPNLTSQKTLESLIEAVREIEGQARECYSVPFDLNQEDFTACLVLDGCFIIELIRKWSLVVPREVNDPIFSMAGMRSNLCIDLILLENQIPWFVLDLLFNKTSLQPTGTSRSLSLTQLVIKFFQSNNVSATPLTLDNSTNHRKSKHLLDLWRIAFVSSLDSVHEDRQLVDKQIPSARNLKNAGIKFNKVVNSSSILNIKFDRENGVLEIPTLKIDETTNVLFRNLISLEQCYPNCPTRFTSYATLLDNLINTEDDITILQEEGIIVNWLNPDDAVKFFNKLYVDAFVIDFSYRRLCREVNEYCGRCWPKWRAAFIHNHFGKPWVIVSEVVAGIILILSLLQTIFTIK